MAVGAAATRSGGAPAGEVSPPDLVAAAPDRKSTRLNSSHLGISYAGFCLKKKTASIHHRRAAWPATPARLFGWRPSPRSPTTSPPAETRAPPWPYPSPSQHTGVPDVLRTL